MSADPPYLTPGTEVSAKYKGAFCEAKVKRCQKTVKCKVAPRDGGPQISVADDAVQGELKIGALVKVRQPDSGQIIDGSISRIIDSSIYTVVFDDGDVATLKRTQICLKGDKHYMEGDTLDRLPLTNPEHFSTPVNLLKKQRRCRSATIGGNQSSTTLSDYSDDDDDTASISRRISPRGNNKGSVDLVGRLIALELGDRKKWAPALVIRPSNHEIDMKNKGLIMVKSFRDNKIHTVVEKQVKEFTKDLAKTYADEKLTRIAVDKALKYLNTKELPISWKRDEILGPPETPKKAPAAITAASTTTAASPTAVAAAAAAAAAAATDDNDDSSTSSSDDGEQGERTDMFIAQLYKFMDDRSTPINKPAQLYGRDVSLSRLYQKVRKYGGFNKVSATGKWKHTANKLGFAGISAGTEMKLLYRRYLLAFEEFYRKMGDTHMFEGSRAQRQTAAGGRNVLPPRDREAQHSGTVDNKQIPAAKASKEQKESGEKKSPAVAEQAGKVKVKAEPIVEEALRRTPVRQASKKEEKLKPAESPRRGDSATRARSSNPKSAVKIEKAAKLSMETSKTEEKPSLPTRTATPPVPSVPIRTATPPVPSLPVAASAPPAAVKAPLVKPKEEPVDSKTDNDSIISDEECAATNIEVDYPPGCRLKVRYGRGRNVKIYDAKVVEVRLSEDKQLLYSVHYPGWNVRHDEVIVSERIVGTTGKCEKKKMDVFKDGYGPGRCKKVKASTVTSASSTGSRTPEPPSGGRTSSASQKIAAPSSTKSRSSAAAVTARTTRSSVTDQDLTLPRPTRSKSADSNLSAVLSRRKSRGKKSALADDEAKTAEPADPDNEESTDEESNVDDNDKLDNDGGKVATVTNSPLASATESSEIVDKKDVKLAERRVKPIPLIAEPGIAAPKFEEKTPRRTARRASKPTIIPSCYTYGIPATTTLPAAASTTADSPATAASDQPSESKKGDESSGVPAIGTAMSSEVRYRMNEVIESVAMGVTASDIAEDLSGAVLKEEDDGPPPVKHPKMEPDDSSGPVPCEEAFVKIEPLRQKKPAARQSEQITDDPSYKVMEEEDDSSELQLPPLIGSRVQSAESESKTSASVAEDSEMSCGSDYEQSKSPPDALMRCEPSVSAMMDQATSNLSLLSEQASLSQADMSSGAKAKQRAAARRQQLANKRSPRHRHAEMEMAAEEVAASPNADHEVSQITMSSAERISPSKLLRAAPPRHPRPPTYNFRIEEELADIEDQDNRIDYLMNKMSEIRSLYGEVKSNLASVERKKKRIRQRNHREHSSHQAYERD